MRNVDEWRPSKFLLRGGRLTASSDTAELAIGSRLVAECVARKYNHYIPKYCRGRLLDLGCGKVPLFEAYKPFVQEIVCSDWPASPHGGTFVDVECDLSQPLPFENDRFDTVILSDVLEHIPEPTLLWREMHRILASDATVLLNVPFLYWLHEEPNDYYRYTEFALTRFASSSGFRVVALEPIGGSPEVIADLLAKHAQMVPLVGNLAASCLTPSVA